MRGMLKHTVHEKRESVEQSQEWSGEIDDYLVHVSEDSGGHVRLHLGLRDWNEGPARIGIFDSCPKNVAELEAFADRAGDVFRQLAAELRAIGKDDLRPKWEREMEANMARFREEAGHAKG